MKQLTSVVSILALSIGTALAQAQSHDVATGNMPLHMDVNVMDANHDGVISKEEFRAYGEKIWKVISHGAPTVRDDSAATDFATGHMAMNVQEMDTDHDGTISHEEFIAYGSSAFDKVKDKNGMLTLTDTTRYFATGNMKP
jgi:hypothetical protein